MKPYLSVIALSAPLLLTWVLTLLFAASGFFGSLLILAVGALSAVGLLVLLAVYITGWSTSSALPDGQRMARVYAAGALGIVLAFFAVAPLFWVNERVVTAVRSPVRAALAERVIDRARLGGWRGAEEVQLDGAKRLLSDGGSIVVYSSQHGVSVLFWDVRGILDAYSASVYTTDTAAYQPPGGVGAEYGLKRERGNWWKTVPE